MKVKDILVAARPDQSLQIYRALLHSEFQFTYITFKVVPEWLKRVFSNRKIVGVEKNAKFVIWGTIKHLAIRKYSFKFARKWSDRTILDSKVLDELRNHTFKIIHLWPENCGVPSSTFRKSNNNCFVIADIHMANPPIVYNEMLPVYTKYGIKPESTSLYNKIDDQKGYIDHIDNVLVPSSYVAETYRSFYPEKKYFVVPYGITPMPGCFKHSNKRILNFVYAGAISLEKGCDLLLDYFKCHNDINIHLFGSVLSEQNFIFDSYKKYENIIFHGRVAKAELQNYLREYDAGIHLSRFDAYSLAVGELIGSGLPVIVSDKTGNADDILKYGFGLVTKLDLDSIESAVSTMRESNNYHNFQDNIFSYLQGNPKDYGHVMLDFYKDIMDGNLEKYQV